MIKKIGLATAMSALLLSGCGGGGSDGSSTTNSAKLVGTWADKCQKYDGESYQSTLVFTSTTLESIEKEYSGEDCDENELIFHIIKKYNYTSGSATKYSNGKDAIEFDIVSTGFTLKKGSLNYIPKSGVKKYSMYSVDGDKLYFSDKDEAEEFNGSTEAKRLKEYHGTYFLTKQ